MTTPNLHNPAGGHVVAPQRSTPALQHGMPEGRGSNFKVDRVNADELTKIVPGMRLVSHASHNCLRRMVATAAGMGLRQFLDLGEGPDQPSYLHEVAERFIPDACYVNADLHAGINDVFSRPIVRARIDLEQPTVVVLGSVVHFLNDDEVLHLFTALWQQLIPGSLLLITAATNDLPGYTPAQVTAVQAYYKQQAGQRAYLRSRAEILAPLGDCYPLPPGLVRAPAWYSGHEAELMDSPAPYHLAVAVQVRPDRNERQERILSCWAV